MLAALVFIAMAPVDPVGPLPKSPPHPRTYGCPRVAKVPPMDGDLHHAAWAKAPWTADFIDIEGIAKPALRTRAKMLWDDKCLYIGAQMEEPNLWATLTKRDSVIFQDNDFEVFLDPDGDNHRYVELEMNALNTVWDLLLPKPYRDGGPALDSFNIEGLRTAVKLTGALNAPESPPPSPPPHLRTKVRSGAHGWSVTIAIPWKALRDQTSQPLPPKKGDRWRINFSRVEWDLEVVGGKYRKIPNRPEHNWVWSPQWAINMHRPETWGFLEFQDKPAPVKPDPYWKERCALMDLYYRLRITREKNGRPAMLAELDKSGFHYEIKDGFWTASLTGRDGARISVREDSLLTSMR